MEVNEKQPSYLSMIALAAIFFNEAENPRGAWEYETDVDPKHKPGKAGGLFEDIEQHGLQTPLWVYKYTPAEVRVVEKATGVRYTYECIRGHRRGRILKTLAARHPGRFETVRVEVYEGLSEGERYALKLDGVNTTKTFGPWGVYLAVKKLVLMGWSEDAIASKLGESRGFVQHRKRIAQLPQCVEDAYLARCKGEPAPNLTAPVINDLAMARNADKEAGESTPEGGPRVREAWVKLVANGAVRDAEPKTLSRKTLLDCADVVKDPILVQVLRYAAGDQIDISVPHQGITALREKASAWDAYVSGRIEPAPPATETPAPPAETPAPPAETPAAETPAAETPATDPPAEGYRKKYGRQRRAS